MSQNGHKETKHEHPKNIMIIITVTGTRVTVLFVSSPLNLLSSDCRKPTRADLAAGGSALGGGGLGLVQLQVHRPLHRAHLLLPLHLRRPLLRCQVRRPVSAQRRPVRPLLLQRERHQSLSGWVARGVL